MFLILPYSGYNGAFAKNIRQESVRTGLDSLDKKPLQGKITSDSLAFSLPEKARDVKVDTAKDSAAIYKSNPVKAVWLSALLPGLGQYYNHRYWKIPVIAAGAAAITYAIGWNNKYYVAYTNAYRDFSDTDPNTDSYMDLLPTGSTYYKSSNFGTILKNRQESYRRSRDLSIIGAVGIYLICILDAYVDAQLYDFDISPNLSVQPNIQPPSHLYGFGSNNEVGLSLSFHF